MINRGSNITGLLFIALGAMLFLNIMFGLDLPVFSIMIGLFLVLLGLRVMFKGFIPSIPKGDLNNSIFEEGRTINASDKGNDYNVIFSKSTVDLSKRQLSGGIERIELNCIFGYTEVILPQGIPIVLKASSAFGAVELPDGTSASFNTKIYKTGNFDSASECLEIEASAVFGMIRIILPRF